MQPSEPPNQQKLAASAPYVRPQVFSATFLAILAVQFCSGITFSSYHLLPNYLLAVRGEPAWVLGATQGSFALAGVVSIPLVGKLLDSWGRLRVLRGALLLGVFSYAAFAWASSPAVMIALRFLHGVAFTTVFNAGATLTVDLCPASRRAEALGYYASAMMVTNAIAPALGETIAASYSWHLTFLQVAGWAVLGLALSSGIPSGTDAAGVDPPESEAASSLGRGLAFTPALVATLLGAGALGVGVAGTKNFSPAIFLDLGETETAPLFVAFTAGALAIRVLFGRLPDRMGIQRAAVWSLGAYSVALFLSGASTTALMLLVVNGVVGLAHGLAYPALSAAVVSDISAKERGRATAYLGGAFNAGLLLGTAGLAPLEPWLGFRGLLVVGGMLLLGASAYGARVLGASRRAMPAPSEA